MRNSNPGARSYSHQLDNHWRIALKNSVKNKLAQPTTWIGLAMLGHLFGVKELAALGTPDAITAIGALAAIFMDEKAKPTPPVTVVDEELRDK